MILLKTNPTKYDMVIVKATNPDDTNSIWKFSQLDLNLLKMVIKGLWVYDVLLDENEMKASLGMVLNHYPHLSGRVVHNGTGISMNNEGVSFYVKHQNNLKISDVQQIKNLHNYFNKGINIPDFVKGKTAPLSIQLTHLSDGCILSIHCSHVCLDGQGFFSFLDNWSKTVKKEPIGEILLALPPNILSPKYTKEEAIKLAVAKQWYRVGLTSLLQLIWQKMTRVNQRTVQIFLSENLIKELKTKIEIRSEKKYSTHSILSALIVKLCNDLNGFTTNKPYSLVTVMNLRSRLKGVGQEYVGNAVTNIVTPEFQSDLKLEEIAAIVNDTIKSMIEAEDNRLEEYVQLNIAAAQYTLPYVPFNLTTMNGSKPTCIYINNLSKFPIYECDFGKKNPVFSYPNDLPDQVKLWPSTPDKPGVNIYFSGYLAKNYSKIKNKREWLSGVIERENLPD